MDLINEQGVDGTIIKRQDFIDQGADLILYKGQPLADFVRGLESGQLLSDLIRKPAAIEPLSGVIDVLTSPTLIASEFSPLYGADNRSFRRFEVTLLADINFLSPVFTIEVNADSAQAEGLIILTGYRWRCKDVAEVAGIIIESEWMDSQTFTTSAQEVNAPTLTVQGAPTDVVESPFLTTSAFSTTPPDADTHLATDWEVRLASNNSLVYSSYNDSINLTSLDIPLGILLENTQYKFRVRHVGGLIGASVYTEVTGTTLAVFPFTRYLAVSSTTTPFVNIYGQDADTFINLVGQPSPGPTGVSALNFGPIVAFSRDGVYFAITQTASPFINIYKRSGDTFTRLANPATLPTAAGNAVAFSADGVYLTVAHATTPFITIYKRSGDVFTKLANPAALPAGNGTGAAFSADGSYFATCNSTAAPTISVYKRSGDVFTNLAITVPVIAMSGVTFSPDGTYLAASSITTPFIVIFKRSGDTFTQLPNPATLPPDDSYGCVFSPDSTYLVITHLLSPFITIYKRSGDTFTKLADPATLPAAVGYHASFSADGQYLAVPHAATPFLTIYKRSGDVFTKLANPATLPPGTGSGASLFPRSFDGLNSGPFSVAALQPTGSFSVAAQETGPSGLAFKDDGTKMYIVGGGTNTVYEYILSTGWDVTTSTLNTSFSVAAQETIAIGLAFKTDGTEMYVIGSATDSVYQYTLSTPWLVSSATFTTSFNVASESTSPFSVQFKTDGTKMFVFDNITDNVFEYLLSTPWLVSSAVLSTSFNTTAQDIAPSGMFFKSNGTKMYLTGSANDSVYEYNLSTPWLVSSASFLQQFNVSGQDTSPNNIFFKPDGTRFFLVGSGNDSVYQYDTLPALNL